MTDTTDKVSQPHGDELEYVRYDPGKETTHLGAIRQLISKDLSEPYSIYVYRYFLYQWPDLCFMALDPRDRANLLGIIVTKLEPHASKAPQPADAPPQPQGQSQPQPQSQPQSQSPSQPQPPLRGYIAMLAVPAAHRGKGIATRLVRMAIDALRDRGADEIALETEVTNVPSLKLYARLGFLKTKRLHRYYLNGNTAVRLVLYLNKHATNDEGTSQSSDKTDHR